jgi:hypothetical protein
VGICKHCRKPAGFLRSKHADCEQQYESGKSQISAAIAQALSSSDLLESLKNRINDIAERSYISDSDKLSLLAQDWTGAVDRFLEGRVLDESEEKRLMELKECFSLVLDRTRCKRCAYEDSKGGRNSRRAKRNHPLASQN